MASCPHILLIGPRSELLAKLLGLPVTVSVVHRPGGERALEQALALRVIDADFTDPDALLAAAEALHRWRPIDAVLGMTELSLYPASVVAQALGARGNPVDAVRCAQNKAAMRQRLADRGIDSTAYRMCRTPDEAREFVLAHPGGTIFKPEDGNGGTGVMLVDDPTAVATAWAWASGMPDMNGGRSSGQSPRVLVEEYLTGRELSVETMTVEGRHQVLAVTAKHTTGEPHFVEVGHDLPAQLSDAEYRTIGDCVRGALDAIGYWWGPGHTEVMLAPDGVRATVIEINARQGGDQIWELVELATGTDVIRDAVIALAFGAGPPADRRGGSGARHGAAAIRFLTPHPGRVVEVAGVDDALAVSGVLRVDGICRPGTIVRPLGDSSTRSGYLIAVGPDTSTASSTADSALSRITVRTEPTDGPGR